MTSAWEHFGPSCAGPWEPSRMAADQPLIELAKDDAFYLYAKE